MEPLSPQVFGAGRFGGPLYRLPSSSQVATFVDPRKGTVLPSDETVAGLDPRKGTILN